jgi:class 3 adenylate cyclase
VEATGTVIADRLGRQKLTKEYLAGPRVPIRTRVTGIIKNDGDMP